MSQHFELIINCNHKYTLKYEICRIWNKHSATSTHFALEWCERINAKPYMPNQEKRNITVLITYDEQLSTTHCSGAVESY